MVLKLIYGKSLVYITKIRQLSVVFQYYTFHPAFVSSSLGASIFIGISFISFGFMRTLKAAY